MIAPTAHTLKHKALHVAESREAIQLRWLTRIRWAALVSLAIIFFGADYTLELGLPTESILEILGVGAASNIVLSLITSFSVRKYEALAGSAIILDIFLLSLLLYFCGGYTNPFSMMFLAYVTLAAVVLDTRWTWIVLSTALVCFCALFLFHVPLPQLGVHAHHLHHEGFSLHLHGMVVAFVLIGVIVASFVTRMNREIAEQAARIVELQRVEDEQRRLMSLATLTAGAAHELATPIGTLSLISEDLVSKLGGEAHWHEDLSVMQQELARCAAILQRMRGNSSELDGEAPHSFKLQEILEELQSEFSRGEPATKVVFDGDVSDESTVFSLREALLSSLRALINNAVQACSGIGSVACQTVVLRDEVQFTVQDSGAGMSDEVKARAGEPFFTSKEPGKGMGLGLYLTKLFALQVGGRVEISSSLGKGTVVSLWIPKSMQV